MRLLPLIAVVVALGMSFGLLTAVGIGGEIVGEDNPPVSDAVSEEADEQGGEEEIDPQDSGEDGFLGLTVGAIQGIMTLLGLILFLPSTLDQLGLPSEAATVIGWAIPLILAIGVVQLAIQYDVR